MLPEIRCTISDNDKIVKSLSQVADFEHLSESIDKFERELNAALTSLITDAGDLSTDCNIDEENEVSDDENQEESISPKKQKTS